jgi:hypothetical protein
MSASSNRFEIKFPYLQRNEPLIESWLSKLSRLHESYPSRRVKSLYLDTPCFKIASDNMAGIGSRFKVRWRSYESLTTESLQGAGIDSSGYRLEIKKKNFDLTSKLVLSDIEVQSANYNPHELARVATRKIYDNLSHEYRWRYFPVLEISYERTYLELMGNSKFRITLDRNIAYRSTSGAANYRFVRDGLNILELKVAVEDDSSEIFFLFRDFPLKPNRSSKYLYGFSRLFGIAY